MGIAFKIEQQKYEFRGKVFKSGAIQRTFIPPSFQTFVKAMRALQAYNQDEEISDDSDESSESSYNQEEEISDDCGESSESSGEENHDC